MNKVFFWLLHRKGDYCNKIKSLKMLQLTYDACVLCLLGLLTSRSDKVITQVRSTFKYTSTSVFIEVMHWRNYKFAPN